MKSYDDELRTEYASAYILASRARKIGFSDPHNALQMFIKAASRIIASARYAERYGMQKRLIDNMRHDAVSIVIDYLQMQADVLEEVSQ